MTQQTDLQNLLAAVTEAIIDDEQNLDLILDRYAVPRADVEGLVKLIQHLHIALVGVRPSRRFAQRLRQELMGQQMNVISRLRYLPPRVQIAAGIALIAGFMLIKRRHFTGDDLQETPVVHMQ